jgi:hypothetical protein
MSAVMIKDLSVTEELDSSAMQAVRGGYVVFPYFPTDVFDINNSKNVTGQQLINQGVTVNNVSGNGNAFVDNVPTTITPIQNAQNNITVK